MIPKKYRFSLRSHPLFFEKASKLFFEYGVVFYVKDDNLQKITQEKSIAKSKKRTSPILVAGIVPKKKWVKASQRNQKKRVLRAALTNVCQAYTSTQQITAVVYLNKNPHSVQKLSDSLSRIIAKVS